MAELTQANRDMAISTPLGEDVVVLESLTGEESLGRPFEYRAVVLSEDAAIDANKLLGENVTVRLLTEADDPRYFNGYVTEFMQVPQQSGRYARYELTLRPWLWFLTRTSDCRVHVDTTVQDIVQSVFDDHGFSDYEWALTAEYPEWEFCVQYRETDFNFVGRLLEKVGIYYYFKHENGKHTLMLVDDASTHGSNAGYEQIKYFQPDANAMREREYFDFWQFKQQVHPGSVALDDFDFKKPGQQIGSTASEVRQHASAEFEIFDYPGDYKVRSNGDDIAAVRMQELAAVHDVKHAAGNVRGAPVGYQFELIEFGRSDQNRKYLVCSSTVELKSDAYESGGEGAQGDQFSVRLTAIDAEQQFRTPRMTPKPEIRGPQTAIVVGPDGDEIHTDEFGRVRVRFHWDRHSDSHTACSCWIRVSNGAAGQKWGDVMVPRIGQEVVVEFLEGDPDQPLVVGRVYNGENMPPYDLPANQTITTRKSNSSKGGGGFNEIRFEDKKDDEQMFVHAQKNMDMRVLADRFENVGHDRHLTVDNDKVERVKNDRHEIVEGHHKEKIAKDRNVQVDGKEAKAVKGSMSLTVDKSVAEIFKDSHYEEVSKDLYLKAKNIRLEASSNITLQVGKSYVAIDSTGARIEGTQHVELEGKTGNVKAKAGMNMEHEAGMNVKIKAGLNLESQASMQYKVQGLNVDVSGSAVVNVKGGIVKIN